MALDELVGERKHVTVLFADIVDSTRLISAMDAEDAAGILGTTVHQIERPIKDFGGNVVQRMGDGILAVFGAPVAMEEHAVHACHAALAMQKTMEALAVALERSSPLAIRIGINTGVVVVRQEGQGAADKMDLTGFPVHLASRLQGLAEPGKICISETTYSQVRDSFNCPLLGQRVVKGVDEPVTVYGLNGAMVASHPQPDSSDLYTDVSFVGRTSELNLYRDHVDRLAAGLGSIVGLWGNAGVGKSRLTAEIRRTAVTPAMRWLECAGVSFGRSINHLPLLQLVRSCIGAGENDEEAVVWNRLVRHITDLFAEESDDVLPYLAMFLGLTIRNEYQEKVGYLDGDAMGLQIRRSLRLLFQRLSWRSPLILVFEDFYWFDDSSAKLVEHLLPLVETEAILICLIGRGEPDSLETDLRSRAAADYPAHYANLALSPLPPTDSDTFLSQLLKDDAGLLRLRDIILRKAEGNPLFIEETVRSLFETGILAHEPGTGGVCLNADIETLQIPDTIHDIVTARIDRLETDVKQILLLASVIGRTFLYRILQSIDKAVERLDDGLATLRRFEFIEEYKISPELEFMFGHAVIQEVTYAGMLRGRRQRLHRQVGEAIEEMESEHLDENSGVLAYHFGQAEIWTKAQSYLLTAGERADRLAADAEALHHYQQCFRAFGDRLDPALRASMERKLGEAHYRRGEHEEAERYFRSALEICGSVNFSLERSVKHSIVRELAIQIGHLLRRTLFPPKAMTTDGDVPDEIEIYHMLSWMDVFSNPERFFLYILMLLNASERRFSPYGIAISSGFLAFACDMAGLNRLARNYLNYAERAAGFAANPRVHANTELALAWHSLYGGRWEDAKNRYANAAMIAWDAGDMRAWGSASWGSCLVSRHEGNFKEAWDITKKMMLTADETGDSVHIRWGHFAEGMVRCQLDQFVEGEASLITAFNLAKDAPDYLLLPQVAAELGLCRLGQDRIEDAAEVLEETMVVVDSLGLRGHTVAALRNATAELRLRTVVRENERERGPAMRQARRACQAAIKEAKIYSGAAPRSFRSMAEYHWLNGDQEKARQFWAESTKAAESLGARYEISVTQISLGSRTGDQDIRQQGEVFLRDIKAISLD